MLCAQMMLVRKAEKLAEGSFIIDPRACSKGLVLGQCVRMILPKTKNTNWAWHTIYMFAVFIMLELRCQTRAQPFLQIRSFLSYSNQDNVDVRAFGNFISSSDFFMRIANKFIRKVYRFAKVTLQDIFYSVGGLRPIYGNICKLVDIFMFQ